MRKSPVPRTALLLVAGALLVPSLGAAKDQAPVYPGKAESMKIAGQLQFRYTYTDAEPGGDPTSEFGWSRARLSFSGDLTKSLYYQMKFAGDNLPVDASKGEGSFGFNTTFLGYHLGPIGNLEAGRFDVEATPRPSSSRMAFADRAVHTEKNKAGGQLGVKWDNAWLDDRIVVMVGAYNGNGDHNPDVGNDNNKMMYGGRILLSPNKEFDFDSESDLKHSDFGVGLLLGAWTDDRGNSDNTKTKAKVSSSTGVITYTRVADPSRATVNAYGGALTLKGKGFFATADFSTRSSDSKDDNDSYEFVTKGWSTQFSYAIPVADRMFIEPKVRYERYSDTNKRTDPLANFAWTTVGFNWFISNYNASLQCDYQFRQERGDAEKVKNDTLIVQGNLYF